MTISSIKQTQSVTVTHTLYEKKNLTNDEFDLAVYKLPCNAGRKNVRQH